MKVIICGSRDFNDTRKMVDALSTFNITHILINQRRLTEEGGVIGTSTLARLYAIYQEIPFQTIKTDAEMTNMNPDAVIAFFTDPSKPSQGTQMMIDIAKKQGIPVYTF